MRSLALTVTGGDVALLPGRRPVALLSPHLSEVCPASRGMRSAFEGRFSVRLPTLPGLCGRGICRMARERGYRGVSLTGKRGFRCLGASGASGGFDGVDRRRYRMARAADGVRDV